jgi:hypothetical protein
MTGQVPVDLPSWFLTGQAQAGSGRGSDVRRLITLIFVDRVRTPAIMVVIRRELPCD